MNITKQDYVRQYNELLVNQADYVKKYAAENPGGTAIIEYNTGEKVSWKKFNTSVSAFAAKLSLSD